MPDFRLVSKATFLNGSQIFYDGLCYGVGYVKIGLYFPIPDQALITPIQNV